MTTDRTQFGLDREALAVQHLQDQGYKILERNYRTRRGEIDIVARHKGTMVFIEVKARRTLGYGHPKLAVTPAKQKKLSMVALEYLKRHQGKTSVKARFDVVTIQENAGQSLIEVIPNAFDLAYPR